ncbi:MAG: PDZ domain-containing protein, partial [Planctomycetota bacterium]
LDRLSGRRRIDALGVVVENLTPGLARELAVETSGILVQRVDPRGKAARFGLQPGDVIIELNGRRVASADELEEAWQQSNRELRLIVSRGGRLLMIRSTP